MSKLLRESNGELKHLLSLYNSMGFEEGIVYNAWKNTNGDKYIMLDEAIRL